MDTHAPDGGHIVRRREVLDMLDRIFPPVIGNQYGGTRSALWILGILVLLKGLMGANSVLNGYLVATKADGIPLDSFTPAGASAVVALLGVWGLCMLLICLLGTLALLRYRAMVPLVFLLLLAEHVGRKLILLAQPVAAEGSFPAVSINAGFLAVTLVGLALSVWHTNKQAGAPT
jgi:hypothetical protein